MYQIVTCIEINSKYYLWPEWELFECSSRGVHELKIDIQLHNQCEYGLEILGNQPGKTVLKVADCLLAVNSDWTEAKITMFSHQIMPVHKLLNALILTHLSTRQAVEIHASLIEVENRGIMFLGVSGIGKTTQAELWRDYRNAEIINGDRVFVKQEGNNFLGCGSPWHGSSAYCLNRQVPLLAMIILKQSKQNAIRRLTGFEMVSSVMNSVFLPSWYPKEYKAACDTLDGLLQTVPVYELSCRPDEDAVRLTEETIFKQEKL